VEAEGGVCVCVCVCVCYCVFMCVTEFMLKTHPLSKESVSVIAIFSLANERSYYVGCLFPDQILDQFLDQILDQILDQFLDQFLDQILDQFLDQILDQILDQYSERVLICFLEATSPNSNIIS